MLQTANNRVKSRIPTSPLIISGSRQRQRYLATPSRTANAPAAATVRQVIPNTFAAYSETRQSPDVPFVESEKLELRTYLRKRPLVIIPTPSPPKVSIPKSPQQIQFFPDSPTVNRLAIMEACLNGFIDVHRAHQLFNDTMKNEKLRYHLDVRICNVFLKAYIEWADLEEEAGNPKAENWRRRCWDLYTMMEYEDGFHVTPDDRTYAIMLVGLLKSSKTTTLTDRKAATTKMMSQMDHRAISLASVVNHPTFSSTERMKAISLLTQSAKGSSSRAAVIAKLESIGVTERVSPDILDDVAEIETQKRRKIIKVDEGGVEVKTEVFETPYNLGVLRENLGQIIRGRAELPDDVIQRQKLLEETAYDSALARFKHEAEVFQQLSLGGNLSQRNLQAWMWDWHVSTQPLLQERITALIEEEQAAQMKELEKGKLRNQSGLAPLGHFLQLLPASKVTLIAILELVNMLVSIAYQDGIRTTRAILTIGAAIEAEHHFQLAKKKDIPIPDFKNRADLPTYSVAGYLELHKERVKAKLDMEGTENWMPPWTQEVRARVGAFVVDALMEKSTVVKSKYVDGKLFEEEQPAFFNGYRYERGFKIGVIKVNDLVAERMSREPPRSVLHPRHLPMVARPKPWLRHNSGGYLYSNSSVMRMKESSEQNSYLKEADSRGSMELIYAGLDVLGKTAWKINKAVFDVTLEVWNKGLEYPSIPPLNLKQTMPDPPPDTTDMKAKTDYAVALKKLAQERSAHHSDRCSTNYKLEIARTFLGEKFYLPHNIDFRGRAYPIPPHLNHMGDDLSRGLLLFAEGRPLGEKGVRWLKIHLSNLYGYDKAPFDDRENFATEHLTDIYDSAENPVMGKQWWLKADDPWQCLATCIEIRNALESPDPELYESCLPVHQDGTCNGLQHYAALGGDVTGARQVNLDVTDRPSDVYTYVSEMAKAVIERDAAAGNEIAQNLLGRVNRKVVKQTVMTTVYGVTYVGAREQIHRQLKSSEDDGGLDLYPWANYLAKVTLNSIGTLFKGAKDIQTWLNHCARLVSKSIPEDRVKQMLMAEAHYKKNSKKLTEQQQKQSEKDKKAGMEQMTTVIWTTLLGLPVVQPYRKLARKQIMTQLQSVYISDPNQPQAVNPAKQVSAFPPNFVHSLDATHMMLTALQCDREGMTFAAVHDSYWTHAATVEDMSVVIRDSFVHLHSSNVLENLLAEFRARYRGYKLPISSFRNKVQYKALANSELSPDIKELILQQISSADVEEDELDAEPTTESVDGILGESTAESVDNIPAEPIAESVGGILEQAESSTEVQETPKKKGKRTKRKEKASSVSEAEEDTLAKDLLDAEQVMNQRYVNLVDVFPPVPEKGKFNIETIKDSPYFFC